LFGDGRLAHAGRAQDNNLALKRSVGHLGNWC
jgi:hypothetical protein